MTEILPGREEKKCELRKENRGAVTTCLHGSKVEFPGSVLDNFQKAKPSKDQEVSIVPKSTRKRCAGDEYFPKGAEKTIVKIYPDYIHTSL